MSFFTFGADAQVVTATLADQRKLVLNDMIKLKKLGQHIGLANEPIFMADVMSLGQCYTRLALRIGAGRARRVMERLQIFAETHLDYFSAMSKLPAEKTTFESEARALFPGMVVSSTMGGAAPLLLLGLIGAAIAVLMMMTSKKAKAEEGKPAGDSVFAPKKEEEPGLEPGEAVEPGMPVTSEEKETAKEEAKEVVKEAVKDKVIATPTDTGPSAEVSPHDEPGYPGYGPDDVLPPSEDVGPSAPPIAVVKPRTGIAPLTAPVSKTQALALQGALNKLSAATRDISIKVAVDGAIGAKTVAAVNRSLTVHVGSNQASANLRTGKLTLADVKSLVSAITAVISTEVARRTSTTPISTTTVTVNPTPSKQGTVTPVTVKIPTKVAARAPIATATKAQGLALQKAINALAAATKDLAASPSGLKVAADGVIGAKTVSAVNRAFTRHIGAGQASANLRTGKLTLADVKSMVNAITMAINTEANRRTSGPVATTQITVKPTASTPASSTPVKVTVPVTAVSKAQILGLQKAINAMATATRDMALKVVADGALGAKTVAAVNRAMTRHVGASQGSASLRTGKLTLADVKQYVSSLTYTINTETARRGMPTPAVASPPKTVTATKPQILVLQKSINALAAITKDVKASPTGLKVVADGALGAKTVSAVNRAMTKHIGAGQAGANLRTGKLTLADVKTQIATITAAINAETRRRGGSAVSGLYEMGGKYEISGCYDQPSDAYEISGCYGQSSDADFLGCDKEDLSGV